MQEPRPRALTIGNFDGVHEGHKRIFRRVVELARRNDWIPAVLTFDPHPTKVLAPAKAPKLLGTLEERKSLMRAQGIEEIVVLTFDRIFSELSPREFVEQILVKKLDAKAVLVGENFRFGKRQSGDTGTLEALGREFGFEAEVLGGVRLRGRLVSSSEIRRLIEEGRVGLAARLLGRPYAIEGGIVSGHGVGSKQTVPTLNLETSAEIVPAHGVYITRTQDTETGQKWRSITNIGVRPTFGGTDITIETYLLDPLAGDPPSRIRLEFLRRVREERRFDSPAELRAQILRDVNRAQTWFRRVDKWVTARLSAT